MSCIDNLKILFAPFLPFTSQKLHELLGYDGELFGDLEIVTYEESTRNHDALIYNGDAAIGRWEKSDLAAGQTLREPQALIQKLDPKRVAEIREEMGLA